MNFGDLETVVGGCRINILSKKIASSEAPLISLLGQFELIGPNDLLFTSSHN